MESKEKQSEATKASSSEPKRPRQRISEITDNNKLMHLLECADYRLGKLIVKMNDPNSKPDILTGERIHALERLQLEIWERIYQTDRVGEAFEEFLKETEDKNSQIYRIDEADEAFGEFLKDKEAIKAYEEFLKEIEDKNSPFV